MSKNWSSKGTELPEPMATATYMSRDDVENLCIRVLVREFRNEGIIVDTEDNEEDEDEEKLSDKSDKVYVDCTVKWQQKLFSQSEIRHYEAMNESNLSSCDVLTKKFYNDVQKLQKERSNNNKKKGTKKDDNKLKKAQIVTLVHDELVKREQKQNNDEQDGQEEAVIISHNVLGARPLTTCATETPNALSQRLTSLQLKNNTPIKPTRYMLIRLDLSTLNENKITDKSDDDRENVFIFDLCLVKYCDQRLQLFPDFNPQDSRRPYRVQMGERIIEYRLVHTSPSPSYEQQLKEVLQGGQISNMRAKQLMEQIGTHFETVREHRLRTVVNGEIVLASNFEYNDGLFVHYLLNLPNGWTCTNNNNKSNNDNNGNKEWMEEGNKEYREGFTQRCHGSRNGVNHLGHSFEFDLELELNLLDTELPSWPSILFEVNSVDKWSRFRTEGYAQIAIPIHVGSTEKTLKTWRPVTNGSELRRFLIGATPQLCSLSSCPLKTINSGSLEVRMHVAHQCQNFINQEDFGANQELILDRLASATLFASVSAVLEAFAKARERLAKATKQHEEDAQH